ncbi:MAG: Rrf2 family transcriptional regulator [Lachnospiraceae bacterium]|nr:Rrf2 family transcriptional regulator [Lachnospiraceae bacterium]
MKISSRGRYAIDLMVDLALYDKGEPISVKDIARRQQISGKYLEQIVSMLQKAGMVNSIRGAQGGYRLKRKPEEYSIGSILRVTEGDLAPVACIEEGENGCANRSTCSTIKIWHKLNSAINEVVDNISLADLVEWNTK